MRLAASSTLPFLALLVAATASSGAARTLARPSAPHSVAVNADQQAQASDEASLELVGQVGGHASAVATDGSYAYVGAFQRLVVVDVRDPFRPRIVGQTEMLPNFGGIGFEGRTPHDMRFPGSISSVAVVDDTVLVADRGAGLTAVDVSNRAAPRIVGSVAPLTRPQIPDLTSLQVVGSTAYLTAGPDGLVMFDVSTPSAPRRVGKLFFSADANAASVAGGYAYVALGADGVQVVDVSDPSAPREVGQLDTPGMAFDIIVAGDLAYIADSASELTVADVSDPTAPRIVAQLDLGMDDRKGAFVLALYGSTAYLGGMVIPLHVIDVSDPLAPRLVNVVTSPLQAISANGALSDICDLATSSSAAAFAADASASPSTASGGYAYVANGAAGLQIFDLGVPTAPRPIGSLPMLSMGTDLAVQGTRAYAADSVFGLQVVDLADPVAPRLAGISPTRGTLHGVAVDGRFAYVADNLVGDLQVVDVSRPDAPFPMGAIETPGDDALRVALSGGHAFVAAFADGLQVVDVRDPVTPRLVGGSNAVRAARDVVVQGSMAYVADNDLGLVVFDIAEPTSPRLLGFHRPDSTLRGIPMMPAVAVSGHHAYVTYHTNRAEHGLLVYDVGNPSAPTLVGRLDTPSLTTDVAVDGRYAYVIENAQSVQMIDVSRPDAPRKVATFTMNFGVEVIAATRGYVYTLGSTGFLTLKPTGIQHVVFLPSASAE